MKLTNQVEEARKLLDSAIERMDDQDARIQALPDDTPEEERALQKAIFDKITEDVTRCRETVERLVAIQRARETVPPVEEDHAHLPAEERAARARLEVKEPLVYRADNNNQVSYFADLYNAKRGDFEAQERLQRHGRQVLEAGAKVEKRDVTTGDPGAGVFVPPMYLPELLAEMPREARPLADALPKIPLPDNGMSLTVPRVTTATTTAVQAAENDPVSETDVDGTLLTVPVVTIAGQNDVSIQALERTLPGMDFIIFQDLRADYDEQLDTQLLSGTGSNGQHRGLAQVSSINTVTYTEASPTVAAFHAKLYDAIQQVSSNRHRRADTLIMHPRRAAWAASALSSTFPLYQLGNLMQAAGTQSEGFVGNIGGLRVIEDANISTTINTNRDEVYAIRSSDLFLAEGPLRIRVFDDVLSGTLQVRLQVVAYSAFVSGRQPKAISQIRGTGLAAPAF